MGHDLLHIDAAACDGRDRHRVQIPVTEYAADRKFLFHSLEKVILNLAFCCHPYQNHRSALSRQKGCLGNGNRRSRRLKHNIRSVSRNLSYPLGDVFLPHIDGVGGTHFFRELQPLVIEVRHNDIRRSPRLLTEA